MNPVVYFDDRYPSMWIDDRNANFPQTISSYLHDEGLAIVNADKLRDFMIEAIATDSAYGRLVVFSQDVVPDTIVEDYDANTTFREYLDAGGSAFWIGDIPLMYVGQRGKEIKKTPLTDASGKEIKKSTAWLRMSPVRMLGIIPIISVPKQTVKFTNLGSDIGLKHPWSGLRPVPDDSGLKALAKSDNIVGGYFFQFPKRRRFKFLERIERIRSPVGEIKFSEKEAEGPKEVHVKYVNAWIKNYDRNHPNSGLYRIWDYGPRHITKTMLEELHSIIKNVTTRLEV
jgi:hypothetical protein